MNTDNDWVVIGRFGRPHGLKGFVSVISFTEPRDNILRYTDWHGCFNTQWQPLKLLHLEITNKFILAQVDGYHERETSARLTNINVAVRREQLPVLQPGEYYWDQLVGMQVVNQQGVLLGTVTEIMPTGSNDVLVVIGEKRHLIPYLPGKWVVGIDDSQRIVTVDWDVDF